MKILREKAVWYGRRLAAMSAPEVFHRLSEAVKRQLDSQAKFTGTLDNLGPLPRLDCLRDALNAWDVPGKVMEEWQESLRQARAGRFFLLGRQWPECERGGRWHLDPVTGNYWPRGRYCFDIDYRHNPDMGDVKYVWELNRLQHLQHVAALAFTQRDPEIGRFCLDELENWIDSNPPYRGINWASGIELALRVVSICIVTTLTGELAMPAQVQKIWAGLAAHGAWLERYPSRYSSANNHRAAEGLGLFVIGAVCPQLPDAARWKDEGWKTLCESVRTQILPDGVGAEQAVAYAAVLLEMLLFGLYLAQAFGAAIPDYYQAQIIKGGEYLRWLTDRGGNQPRIGDDDNSCVLGAYHYDGSYVRSVLGCIAAMSRRADLTPPAYTPHFREIFFGAPPKAALAPQGVRCFERGGYTVGRHSVNGHDALVAMDHGPLGYLSIAAHGHADSLALWLHIDDQPVFVDAGTYLYHAGGAWRKYFRGTAAHNTLCLEDADSSTMAGPFNWSRKAQARLSACSFNDAAWWVEAEHNGYRKKLGVTHHRRLEMNPDAGFLVTDWITGDVPRHAAVRFLLHPDLLATQNGKEILISKGSQVLLRIENRGPLTAVCDQGWYSPSFGVKQPTARIVFSGPLAPEQKSVLRFAIA